MGKPKDAVQLFDDPAEDLEDSEFVDFRQRKCTDVGCCVIFLMFIFGMLGVAYLGITTGNPYRLIRGIDMYGNICGTDNSANTDLDAAFASDMTNKTVLYWVDPIGDTSLQACIEACPESSGGSVCTLGNSCNTGYSSSPVFSRCIPSDPTLLGALDSVVNSQAEELSRYFGDLMRAWAAIVGSMGAALVWGFVWLLLLQYVASTLVWISVIATPVILGALTAFCLGKAGVTDVPTVEESTSLDDSTKEYVKYLAYLLGGLMVILIFVILFMAKRIRISVGIVKEASRAIRSMPLIIFFPLTTLVWMVIIAGFWLVAQSYIASSGSMDVLENGRRDFVWSDMMKGMTAYLLLGALWLLNFVVALGETTIAGAVSAWYWSKPGQRGGTRSKAPVWSAWKRTLKYHMGTLALGSFLVALIQFVRIVLAYLDKQAKKANSKALQAMLKCLGCCLMCFEKLVKFVNKNAYIQTAMSGSPFCVAAKNAFQLLVNNALRLAAVNFVGSFLMFLGKVFVVAMSAGVTAYALSSTWYYETFEVEAVSSIIFPVAVSAILCWFVADAFMSVFDLAIDTILQCFCVDCERNNGSAWKPYYMSDSMRKYVTSHSKDSQDASSQEREKLIAPQAEKTQEPDKKAAWG